MKKQCQAYANSSNSRCEKNPLPWSRYCWWHQPKALLGFSFVIGTFLSLVAPEAYHKFIPTKEAKALVKAQKAIDAIIPSQTDILTGDGNTCHFIAAVGSNLVWYIDMRRLNKDAPLYDVKATITDIAEVWRLHKLSPKNDEQEYVRRCTQTFELGTLNETDRAKLFRREPVGDKQWGLYEISFSARNGRWAERIAFAFRDDRGYVAYHVKPSPEHSPKGMTEIIYIPDDFPTNHFDMNIIKNF